MPQAEESGRPDTLSPHRVSAHSALGQHRNQVRRRGRGQTRSEEMLCQQDAQTSMSGHPASYPSMNRTTEGWNEAILPSEQPQRIPARKPGANRNFSIKLVATTRLFKGYVRCNCVKKRSPLGQQSEALPPSPLRQREVHRKPPLSGHRPVQSSGLIAETGVNAKHSDGQVLANSEPSECCLPAFANHKFAIGNATAWTTCSKIAYFRPNWSRRQTPCCRLFQLRCFRLFPDRRAIQLPQPDSAARPPRAAPEYRWQAPQS